MPPRDAGVHRRWRGDEASPSPSCPATRVHHETARSDAVGTGADRSSRPATHESVRRGGSHSWLFSWCALAVFGVGTTALPITRATVSITVVRCASFSRSQTSGGGAGRSSQFSWCGTMTPLLHQRSRSAGCRVTIPWRDAGEHQRRCAGAANPRATPGRREGGWPLDARRIRPSVQSAGTRALLPSGKIRMKCRRSFRCVCPRTANDRPSNGCFGRTMVTRSGRSSRWVVCRTVLRHGPAHIGLAKVARRIRDDAVLWLLRLILKASGRQGVSNT